MDKGTVALLGLIKQGRISRRDLLRYAALLGLSAGAAEALAACAPQVTPTAGMPTYLGGGESMPTRVWTPAVQGHVSGMDVDAPTPDWTPPPEPTATTPPPQPLATATPVMWEPAQWICPQGDARFDTQDALVAHVLEKHARKVPGARRVSQPTYAQFIAGPVERFDQRNHVFSRTVWDKDYQQELTKIVPRTPRESPEQILEGMAFVAGSIYTDDAVGSLNPNYRGYSGHLQDTGGMYDWNDPVSTNQYPVSDPVQMSLRIKQVARIFGADLVGITRLDQRWVYSHYFDRESGAYGKLNVPYPFAIVMAIEMDWAEIATSPRFGASAITAHAYSRMGEISSKLAKYIRTLGFPAVPSGNDSTQSIPLAIDAGLGELGRLGLLLTPEFGGRQRICKVYTDLPLVPDQPIDFGMQRYCETCFVCAKNCPAKAIRTEERTTQVTSISNRTGLRRWPVNVSECYKFWRANGMDCSNCIRACPWSLPNRGWL
jgi:epoxyqueuosine reductase